MTQLLRNLHIHIYLQSYLPTSYLPIPVKLYVPLPCCTFNVQLSCFFFSSSSRLSTRATHQCAYASSACDQKKITLYRNFFRNLNFNNIVNFFKRTCWLISSCRRTGETILSNYWQSPKITATVHYFHYNSQHHYHYYHFHYHFKMPLYRLQILLTILFTVI